MEWTWRQIAHYLGPVRLQVELTGITEEGLRQALHQGALERLKWVETVVFNEELTDQEKISTLTSWFLAE